MVAFHSTVGTLVVLGFLLTTVLHGLALFGRPTTMARQIAFASAALLVLQYILGFGLLASDHEITGAHWGLAILAILTVGLEHGFAANRPSSYSRALWSTFASLATLIIVLITYIIGQSN